MQNDPDRVVGLIIASAPGEGIQHWNANSSFSQTIESKVVAAINAQGTKSEIDGILWHQGETDWQFSGTSDPDASDFERSYPEYYPEKLDDLIDRFRSKNWFSNAKPFICGETKQAPVNERLMALNSSGDPWTRCATASDLTTLEMDLSAQPPKLGTHFDAASLRTLGHRYAAIYGQLVNPLPKIDNTIPVAKTLSPVNSSVLTPGVSDITGTASDVGSGVSRVRVQIRRTGVSPLFSWDGNAWSTTLRFVDANLESDGSWILPDVDLGLGSYRIFLAAYDHSGNLATWRDNAVTSFTVRSSDSTKPIVQVTTPAPSSVLNPGISDITGTASDNDSGVSRVRVQIRAIGVSSTLAWDGHAWTSALKFIDASLNSDGSWIVPDVDLSAVGNYRIFLMAHDHNGNIATWRENPLTAFSVRSNDVTLPTAQVVSPAKGSVVNQGIFDVTGIASDSESGISRVRVQVRAVGVSPLLSWDGNAWVTVLKFIEADLHSDGSWTVPDIDFDGIGSYRVFLMAYDKNGNIARWRDNPIGDFQIQ